MLTGVKARLYARRELMRYRARDLLCILGVKNIKTIYARIKAGKIPPPRGAKGAWYWLREDLK